MNNSQFSSSVQQVLQRTRESGGFSAAQYRDIEAAVASSPSLQGYIEHAARGGDLRHIAFAEQRPGIAGFYDEKNRTINLMPRAWGEDGKLVSRLDHLTGTLGHETGHAILRSSRQQATDTFAREMYNASFDQEPNHTQAFQNYISHMRRDEALAESFGWNAVHSRVKREMGEGYAEQDFFERVAPTTHCIDESLQPAPGLQLASDGRIQLDTALPNYQRNVEAMSRCHFDRDIEPIPGRSGAGIDYNYRNLYGAWAAGVVHANAGRLGASDTLRLDFDQLGLDPAQMEKAGINLGGKGNTLAYHALRGERVVASGHLQDLGIRQEGQNLEAGVQTTRAPSKPGMDHHSHPQYPLYRTLQNELPQATSTDRLTQITAYSHIAGITPHNLWGIAVSKDEVHVLGDQPGMRADIKLQDLPPSQEQSQQQVNAYELQQQMERAQQQRAQGMSMH
ncbi:MAG: hypothetical protein Q4G62_09490 [Pseudomonadota bacterium]|nr:hypothetical protein [Pseudomonadota bacterium]